MATYDDPSTPAPPLCATFESFAATLLTAASSGAAGGDPAARSRLVGKATQIADHHARMSPNFEVTAPHDCISCRPSGMLLGASWVPLCSANLHQHRCMNYCIDCSSVATVVFCDGYVMLTLPAPTLQQFFAIRQLLHLTRQTQRRQRNLHGQEDCC